MNQVVSFESKNGMSMKKVARKTRRQNAPGIIEREEIMRCDRMEFFADLSCLKDKQDSWYERKYGLDY